ncbi:MAG: prolyl oligopeptidase family serine peptidase [Streptosporangiaceae bacterium]
MTDSFPRQEARTRRFTLGVPRAFHISPDGGRVAYLRTQGGTDPVTCLWVLDVGPGTERLAVDPATLGGDEENLPPAERARRERVREQAGGIVSYSTDAGLTVAVFAWSGRVWAVDLTSPEATAREVLTKELPALEPRLDPAGRRLAYVHAGALRVTGLDGSTPDQVIADPRGAPQVTYGLAEFVAAEEMDRYRGYWWSPDGSALLVARVDESPVNRWHIADPAHPERPPAEVAYPAAGTPNAEVSLLLARLDGTSVPVDTGQAAFPYLVTACWQGGHDPLVVVQSRDQRRMRLLSVDAGTGQVSVLREDTDPQWLDIVPGVPAWTRDGRIVWTGDDGDTRRLLLIEAPGGAAPGGAAPVTPLGLQVRGVIGIDGDTVLFQAGDESTEIALWAYGPDGLSLLSEGHGVAAGVRAGGTTVITSRGLDTDGVTVQVYRPGHPAISLRNLAERPMLPAPRPELLRAGAGEVRTAVLFPSWHQRGQGRLPVLLDPYGGPHAQRVVQARGAYLTSQWFAEQGFAVVVADGRGTPGRGPAWERAVAGDLASPVLADQIDALHAAADRFADLDTGRVAIRGWSFGGYLAALAVLRRPDVFHAAIAGAPVTDWRLYDTHYSERYLGHPGTDPGPYERSSLISEVTEGRPARPLMLIHGMADDNVVVAHTLRLSAALLAAGYPHTVLPLSGVTHMASQETVAENLLLLQLDFLRRALGVAASGRAVS